MSLSLQDFQFTIGFGLVFFVMHLTETIQNKLDGKPFPSAAKFWIPALTPYLYGWVGLLIAKPTYANFGHAITYGAGAALVAGFAVLIAMDQWGHTWRLTSKAKAVIGAVCTFVIRSAFACLAYVLFTNW